MNKFIATIAVATLLIGCDGENPFDEDEVVEDVVATPGATEDTVADDGTIFATDLNEDLTANAFEFDDQGNDDPADDILRVNNIPFDNSDLSGGGYTRSAATLPNAFDIYESDSSDDAERQYFAVFQRATYSEVAAIGSGDFITFGFGGATAQQLNNSNGIPASRPEFYTFTGDYAAVRITTNAGGRDDVGYITGDANLSVDIPDFDDVGAIDGVITNRELFDVDGNSLGNLNDFISLGTAEIDFETGDIGSATAVGSEFVLNPDTNEQELDQGLTGDWQGVFAGPNGEEIAGFVVLEGTTTAAEVEDSVRETGVFIVTNTELE